jgi:hypothetical protein
LLSASPHAVAAVAVAWDVVLVLALDAALVLGLDVVLVLGLDVVLAPVAVASVVVLVAQV